MVKNKILNSLVAFTLLGGIANADIIDTCKAENPDNFDDELSCISNNVEDNLIKRNNKLHYVIAKSAAIGKNQSDPDFYNYLDATFQKIMLDIKLDLVSSDGLAHAGAAMLAIEDNSENEEAVTNEAVEEATEKMLQDKRNKEYEGILDGILKGIKKRLGVAEDAELTAEQKEKAKGMAQKAIYSETFQTSYAESTPGVKRAQSLVTYATIVNVDKDGEAELGVVAYISDASSELYRALINNSKFAYKGNPENCKSAKDVLASIPREQKLGKIGTTFYRDENCQPALLSFATHSFHQTNKALAKRLKATAKDKAALVARDNLSQFLGTTIAMKQEYKLQLSAIQKVMATVIEDAIDKGAEIDKTDYETKLKSTFNKIVKSNTKANTKGMATAGTWYDDLGNVGVVGVAISYSVGNKEVADEFKNMINQSKTKAPQSSPKSKVAPIQKPNSSYNRNSVVDDF